jgi:hypothetical protein
MTALVLVLATLSPSCSQHERPQFTSAQARESMHILELIDAGDFKGAEAALKVREARLRHADETTTILRRWIRRQNPPSRSGPPAESSGPRPPAATLEADIAELKEEGMRLYSEGHVESAATRWERVLQLAPDDQEARKLLLRARRVLDNNPRSAAP